MKPIIQKLWMVMAMLCLTISASAYDFIAGGIAYTITSFSDLTCAVSPSDEIYEGEITVPSNVMFNEKTLTVTSISSGAFQNSHITSVRIPETVVEIEASAFSNCENLTTIGIKEGLLSIGENSFNGCVNLLNVDFPNSLKTIGSGGFANCKSLSQINLPCSMTNLGASAFMNCENVRSVSLSNISILEANTFKGCLNLHKIEWGNDLKQIKDYAFANCGFTTFVIPNTVTAIGSAILLNNKNLQSFTIGNGISKISSNPIEECPVVSDFIIADGFNALSLDFSLDEYSKVDTERSTSSDDYWKAKYYYTRLGAYSTSTFENVYIGRHLYSPSRTDSYSGGSLSGYPDYWYYYYTLPPFYGNNTIKSVTFGPNVSTANGVRFTCGKTSYCYGFLEGCSNIETITISELSVIPTSFAKDAISLKSIELPNITLTVEMNAFYNCASLESIILGAKLSKIASNALDNCNALTSIYCKSKTPPTYLTGFSKDIYLNCHLYIPFETEQSYKSTSPWNNFWNISESQECVYEFEKDGLIYNITSGNDVVVSGNAIRKKSDIIIPSRLEYYAKEYNVIGIGANAFKGTSNLQSIVIPESILKISNDAFSRCDGLTSVTIEHSDKPIILGYQSSLKLSSIITPYPNPTTVDERRIGFRKGYYDGLFSGLPIEHLIINRDIELPKYYERAIGSSTSSYSTVYNDIIYFPPFDKITNLKYVEIGENVSAICKNQIEAVDNIVPITMEYTNFGNCDNIKVVVSNNPIAPIGGGFTQDVYKNATLFLPNGGEESYKNDKYWKQFSQIIDSPFVATESISFDADEVIIDINESKTLLPTINPEDASIKKLKWSSSAPSIVSVSKDGIISSYSQEGEAIITVTACDGSSASASIKIIVQENSGIFDALEDNPFTVNVENGSIVITGKTESDVVEIYNIQGQLITSSTNNIINLNAHGVYLVKIRSHCEKIIL